MRPPASCPRSRSFPNARRIGVPGLGWLAAVLVGCSGPGVPAKPLRLAEASPVRVVRGDWNDLAAAVSRAAPEAALARLRTRIVGNGSAGSTARADLLAIDGQPAQVLFVAIGDWSAQSGPAEIRVEASFGKPNDTERAAALAERVADELAELAGVDYAP